MRLPFDIHATLEFLAGLVLILCPLALGFDPLGMIVSILLGVILTGSALGLTASRRPSPIVHRQFDSLFGVLAALAALGLALAGQPAAVILLTAVVVLQTGLSVVTRYAVLD
jgi:hypothetical protein